MAVIVNGDGILTGVSSLTTALDDITSGRGTVTGVTTVGTLQLGAGVSISSPRSQNAAIFTNDTEFFTVDDAGRVGVGTITPNSDAHPQNVGKINVGFITARSVAGDIDANTLVVAGLSTFTGVIDANGGVTGNVTGNLTGTASGNAVLTGSTNNQLVTVTGANAITGEATLTYNGTDTFELQPASATPAIFIGDSNRTGAGQGLVQFRGNWNGTTVARITFDAGDDTTNKDDGIIRFDTAPSGSLVERLRITSDGKIGQNTTSPSYDFHSYKASGTVRARLQTNGTSGSDYADMVVQAGGGNYVQQFIYGSGYGYLQGSASVSMTYGNIANAPVYFATNNTSRAYFDTSGNLQILDGNLKINTSGHGIDFSATSDGSGTDSSELFDDYEEGSFTPSYPSGSSGGNMLNNAVYTNTTGYYTKIGGCVTFSLRIQCSSHTVIGGQVRINGLPYANGASNGKEGGAFFNYSQAVDTSNSGYLPTMHIANNSSTIFFYTPQGNSYNAGAGGTNWNLTLHITGVYHTF